MPEKRSTTPRGYLRWLALGTVALCAVLVVLVWLRPGMNPYSYSPYAFYILQPEETTETVADNGMVTRCYSFTVPDGAKVRHGARLSVFLRHCYAKVFLDDELRYSSWDDGSSHIGKTPGCYWLTAAMRSFTGASEASGSVNTQRRMRGSKSAVWRLNSASNPFSRAAFTVFSAQAAGSFSRLSVAAARYRHTVEAFSVYNWV